MKPYNHSIVTSDLGMISRFFESEAKLLTFSFFSGNNGFLWGLQLLDPIIIVIMERSREPEKVQPLSKLLMEALSGV